MALSSYLSQVFSILISLPFVYGFSNPHWEHMTDVMIFKKPGIRHIHTVRIIGLVSAEFNTALKFFFSRKAMTNYENANPCSEQWGSRRHRRATDAAMLKLLTFEAAR